MQVILDRHGGYCLEAGWMDFLPDDTIMELWCFLDATAKEYAWHS